MDGGLTQYYFRNYKKFLYVPFIILIAAFVLIGMQMQSTGDFINKDITLKGGVSLTILTEQAVDLESLEGALANELSPNEVTLRTLQSTGRQIGILMESDLEQVSQEKLAALLTIMGDSLGKTIEEGDYSLETTGSSLGESFFQQTMRAMLIAFVFMGVVVFLYFRNFVPSMAVILSAVSDIVVTVAIFNLLGLKMGTAGVAALLMLIGYSIDTDIMLTTRMLKRTDETLEKAFIGAFKTGMTMTLSTLAAVTVGIIFTDSEVIRQIMTILLIGLVIDIINTWLQNAGLLVWWVKKKHEA